MTTLWSDELNTRSDCELGADETKAQKADPPLAFPSLLSLSYNLKPHIFVYPKTRRKAHKKLTNKPHTTMSIDICGLTFSLRPARHLLRRAKRVRVHILVAVPRRHLLIVYTYFLGSVAAAPPPPHHPTPELRECYGPYVSRPRCRGDACSARWLIHVLFSVT